MSLSRAELEAMDRDELIEAVVGLQDRVADLEAQPSLDAEEMAAVRRLLAGLSGVDDDELLEMSAPERATDSVERINDIDDRLAAVEGHVSPHTGTTEYDDMDRDDRVFELRVALAVKARNNGGAAAYTYDQVTAKWDEKPSAGYAYKLMKLAADYDADTNRSKKDGYIYTTNPDGQRQLRCAVADVNDEAALHAVKNMIESGGD